MRFIGKSRLTKSIFVVALVAFNLSFPLSATVSAACAPPTSTDFGKVTFASVSVGENASYRVWTRMQTPSTGTGYTLRIDDNTCINVAGGSALSSWTWVDYKDGNTSSKTTVPLTAGSHKIELIGTSEAVLVDRIILTKVETNGTTCVPNQTVSNPTNPDVTTRTIGDNCTTDTTPTLMPGDTNGSNTVTITDLNAVINHWGLTGQSRANGDLTGEGNVTITDLNQVINNWTR